MDKYILFFCCCCFIQCGDFFPVRCNCLKVVDVSFVRGFLHTHTKAMFFFGGKKKKLFLHLGNQCTKIREKEFLTVHKHFSFGPLTMIK